jgi:hypothetical protein
MPALFVAAFIALAFIFPRAMSYTVIAPILGFTFGGFLWAIGGFVGFTTGTLVSFCTCVGIVTALFEVYFISKLN